MTRPFVLCLLLPLFSACVGDIQTTAVEPSEDASVGPDTSPPGDDTAPVPQGPPPPPPDGVYHVAVEALENTCDNGFGSETWADLYDVYPRLDGTYVLGPYNDGATWPVGFSDVELTFDAKAGAFAIDHKEKWKSARTRNEFENYATGTVTQDAIDLVITRNWELDDGKTPCVQRAKITGKTWKFLNPTALEGVYRVQINAFTKDDFICPDDTLSERAIGYSLIRLIDTGDHKTIQFSFYDAALRGRIPLPDANGKIEWEGNLESVIPPGGWTPIIGSASGTLRYGKLDLTFEFRDFEGDPCFFRFHFVGEKIVPGGGTLTNEYRANRTVQDVCSGITKDLQTRFLVIDQGDGLVEVISTFGTRVYFPVNADGSFRVVVPSATDDGAAMTTVEGDFAPPALSWVATTRATDGRSCDVEIIDTVDGLGRFTFDESKPQ